MPVNFVIAGRDLTPLILAAENGKLDAVKQLVSKGVDVKQKNSLPIFCACVSGYHQVASYLAEHYTDEEFLGAGICSRTDMSLNLIHIIASGRHTHVMKLLVEREPKFLTQPVKMSEKAKAIADEHAQDGDTPLMVACRTGHVEMVKYLIGIKDHDLTVKNSKNGQNALHAAVRANHVEVVKALLKVMSDKDVQVAEYGVKGKSVFEYAKDHNKSSGFMGNFQFGKKDYTEMLKILDTHRSAINERRNKEYNMMANSKVDDAEGFTVI